MRFTTWNIVSLYETYRDIRRYNIQDEGGGMKIVLGLIAVLLLAGCFSKQPKLSDLPAPIALTEDVCSREPELCTESCKSCKDKQGCLLKNGECGSGKLYFDDRNDVGADIWTPGCHYEYTNPACSKKQTFFLGDVCGNKNPNEIIEWTVSTCHGQLGDRKIFDCDKECKRNDLGGGTCVELPDVCNGNPSAACKCDKPLPNQ
jgi:hypothetical protein